MYIQLPGTVSHILHRLNSAGFEAYAVGGCVRDCCLGRVPNDWDITTSALPEQIKALFRHTVDTGIKHGTVTVLEGDGSYEVTTYRVDGSYSDSRHPDSVSFTRSLTEDLKRRDFTINAMAYSDTDGLVDCFDGVKDLEEHTIRCVGVPEERFGEDALRIMRAVRFSAQLDFSIDPETRKATKLLSGNLSGISAERICAELDKLLVSRCPDRLHDMYLLGISAVVLPELDRFMDSVPDSLKLFDRLKSSPSDRYIRWALLFSHIGSGPDIMSRLKFDNRSLAMISLLTSHADDKVTGLSLPEFRRLVHEVGSPNVPLLLTFIENLHGIDAAEALSEYKGILERGECTSLKELAVSGRDLIGNGFPAGSEMGLILDGLLSAVLEDPSLNNKEALLQLAESIRLNFCKH